MAERLGLFSQWLLGAHAERSTINANADALESVEKRVEGLRGLVERQASEITELRATIMGLAEVLQARVPFESRELERAVRDALDRLEPPPPPPDPARDLAPPVPYASDPYRGLPTSEHLDIEAAKKLMRAAEEHHYSKRFAEARAVYQQVVDNFGATKQAAAARLQLENLRDE